METKTLKANESRTVLGEIGQIDCINIAKLGEPECLRYFGRGKGCSGQAHETEVQAEQDVRDWHKGVLVEYQKHAELPKDWQPTPRPLGLPASTTIGAMLIQSRKDFVIGPDNTYWQAFAAMLAGHQVRQPHWDENVTWIFENNCREIMRVYGHTKADWQKNALLTHPAGAQQLACNWTVLPKIHPETPTV